MQIIPGIGTLKEVANLLSAWRGHLLSIPQKTYLRGKTHKTGLPDRANVKSALVIIIMAVSRTKTSQGIAQNTTSSPFLK